jgi:hypothetical protein
MGSVAEAVIRNVRGPLMLVGPNNKLGDALPACRTWWCLDGSDAAKAVLPAATALALAWNADLRLVQVVLPPEVIGVTGPRKVEAVALEGVAKRIRDAASRPTTTSSAITTRPFGLRAMRRTFLPRSSRWRPTAVRAWHGSCSAASRSASREGICVPCLWSARPAGLTPRGARARRRGSA